MKLHFYKLPNLSLNEAAIDVAQNRLLRETDAYVWRYTLLVVLAIKEEEEEKEKEEEEKDDDDD